MTNQTIHPCPKCEVVPEVDLCYTPTSVVVCCQLHPAYSVDTVLWVDLCDLHLGRACREFGIETVEQLNVIVRMACELRNMTAIHDYEEQVYQKIVPEIRAEYE